MERQGVGQEPLLGLPVDEEGEEQLPEVLERPPCARARGRRALGGGELRRPVRHLKLAGGLEFPACRTGP